MTELRNWPRNDLKSIGKGGENMAAVVDETKCTGCGTCAEVCPVEAIKVDDVAHVDPETCVDCGTCAEECPNGAITVE